MSTSRQNGNTANVECVLQRIFEGIGSLLGIITSSCILYIQSSAPARAREYLAWQVAISVEFFIALFIAACLIFVRAVAAPKWPEKITARRVLVAFGLLFLLAALGTSLRVI